ncbi:MAG: hypothetical protein SGI77_26295, partial [Pirellulaceae bacterium]|nr:hypothetical protein [Pirellulaceae bacterium]
MKILALDLGKSNNMCCFFDTKTRKHSFLNASTDRNDLATVFKKQALPPNLWVKIDYLSLRIENRSFNGHPFRIGFL